jgi:hypothetical protein
LLQGIVLPKIHFDGKIAKFSRTLIFEFCNTIGGQSGHPGTTAWRQLMTRSGALP